MAHRQAPKNFYTTNYLPFQCAAKRKRLFLLIMEFLILLNESLSFFKSLLMLDLNLLKIITQLQILLLELVDPRLELTDPRGMILGTGLPTL